MVILLANTWSPYSGLLRSDAVPRYMATFITQLLASLRQPHSTEETHPSRLRFLLRRKDHIHALQSSVAALLKSDSWEASVLENLEDTSALNHVLDGVKVVLWVDDGKHVQLARDGQTLLHQAAECGVRSFVYRAQVQGKSRKSTDAAIALLNDYSITHSLPITIIESQPLFVLPMIKNHRTDDLSFTISSADHIASHPTLLHLAQAEAALVVRCHNREKFDLSIARHYELGSRQIGEPRSSLGSSSSPIRATGGGRRATGRARSRAPEIHETLERLHEAWLSYYPISKSKTPRNLFGFLTRMTSQSDIAAAPMVDVGGIAVTKTLLVSSDSGYGSTPTLPRKYKRRYKDPDPLPDSSLDDANSMIQSVESHLVSSKSLLPDMPALHIDLEESMGTAL